MNVANGRTLLLQNLQKKYGNHTVVEDLTLQVESGEFLTLLGPSGSGKSTLLNMIAGFSAPTSGRLLLDGRDITDTPPEKRSFGMVFQGYALFPHMTVAENVGFPLLVRGVAKSAREDRIRGALDLVQLGSFADRKISQLSGGQQQRVALARALIFDPALLLLDEPLSALDKKLRTELQEELKSLHQRIGRTFINVTHDQDEALSMSDRIAILNRGGVAQYGTPTNLYERPQTRFVANFLGYSNFITAKVTAQDSASFTAQKGNVTFRAAGSAPKGDVLLSLRPEKIEIFDAMTEANSVRGKILSWSYLGSGYSITVDVPELGQIKVSLPAWKSRIELGAGMDLILGWMPDALVPVTEERT